MSIRICAEVDDLELFLTSIHIDIEDDGEGVETAEFYSLLDVGGFSDGNEDTGITREQAINDLTNITDEDDKFTAIRELNNISQF